MIRLGRKEYKIKDISKESFWEEMDKITVGQNMNPQLAYTTQYYAQFDNVFAGKKTGDTFSIYLYKPISRMFRTEILAKGSVKEEKDGVSIKCHFEIPILSVLIFLLLSFIIFGRAFMEFQTIGIFFFLMGLAIYLVIIDSNYKAIHKELQKQFDLFGKNSNLDKKTKPDRKKI